MLASAEAESVVGPNEPVKVPSSFILLTVLRQYLLLVYYLFYDMVSNCGVFVQFICIFIYFIGFLNDHL